MVDSSGQPAQRPMDVLTRLHTQLHLLIPTLILAQDRPETSTMLVGLRETTSQATHLLAVADPVILAAIHAGLRHAAAGEHEDTRSELLAAYRRLSVLIHRDLPRRAAASHERTRRWRPDPP